MKILVFLLTLCTGIPVRGAEYHEFKTVDGKFQAEASLAGMELDKAGTPLVLLKRKVDGTLARVKLTELAAGDREWIDTAGKKLYTPPFMSGRLTPESRAQLRKESGADAAAEQAVERGLDWLIKHQNEDGSWGKGSKAGMTGLALLALTGHGHSRFSSRYGEAVKKGTLWLMNLATDNATRGITLLSQGPPDFIGAYEHGIATQALAEVYALSPPRWSEELRKTVEKAVSVIVEQQSVDGSWHCKKDLGFDKNGKGLLSLTCWQIQPLWICRDSTDLSKIRGVPGALKKAGQYLKSTQGGIGGFGNPDMTGYENQMGLTGAALFNLSVFRPESNAGNDRTIRSAVRAMKDHFRWPSWAADCDLCTWYFDSLALYQTGGESWTNWYPRCEAEVLANHTADGSWKVEGKSSREVFYAVAWGDPEMYRNTMALLILETPVRYRRSSTVKQIGP